MFSEIQRPTPIRRPRMQLKHEIHYDLKTKKCVGQLVADIGLTEEGPLVSLAVRVRVKGTGCLYLQSLTVSSYHMKMLTQFVLGK